jgi:excinuclease UvrABC ATPase subunit
MDATRECKSCGINVQVDIDKVVNDETKSVSDDIYEKRLAICMECPSLQYGTTCQHSGDIVTYRAFMKEKSCPYPGTPKWCKE